MTVIEILLSAVIVSIVSMAAYRVLAVALKAKERSDTHLKRDVKVMSAIHQLEEDFNSVAVYQWPSGAVGLEARAQGIAFVSRKSNGLAVIAYGFNESGDWVRVESPLSALSLEPKRSMEEGNAVFPAHDIKNVSLSFGYKKPQEQESIMWKEDWHNRSIPYVIRFQAELWGDRNRQRTTIYERTFCLPHGEWGQDEGPP